MPTTSTIGCRISSRRRASRCWRWKASACSASASRATRARPTSSRSAARLCAEAPDAEGLLISCGGLRTLGVREAARGAPRHSGRHQHAGGVLGGAAARRRQRPCRRPRPAAGAIGSRRCALRRSALKLGAVRRSAPNWRVRCPPRLWSEQWMPYRKRRNSHEGPRHRHPEIRHPRSAGQGDRGRAESLGVDGVASVRQGKVFDIEIEGATASRPRPRSRRRPTSSSPIR